MPADSPEPVRQQFEMVLALGENQGNAAVAESMTDIVDDHLIAGLVVGQLAADLLDAQIRLRSDERGLEPTATCQVLLAAGKHLVSTGRPLVYADSGVENVNGAVDATLLSACLDRILAQVDVGFSNSMIEAFWRSLKHQWLYLSSLDSLARLRTLVEFFIEQHNTQMPHSAFAGQTPDEMYFGTAADLPTELAAARSQARAARLAANRAMSCDRCIGRPADLPALEIPP